MDKRGRLTPARAVNEVFGMSPTMDRAAFLPVGREPGGETEFAWPGLLYDAARAMVTPGVGVKGGKVTLDDVNRVAMEAGILGSVARRPANSLGMFGGVKAKTADLGALGRAHELLKQGADARKIWDETGWFQGADGKWRFEIDDSAARLADEMNSLGVDFDRPLGDLVQHEKAYAAYPDTADIHVETFGRSGKGNLPSGAYMADRDRMQVRGDIEGGALSTALHETQHAIQNREGFARGGSPGDAGPNALGPTPDMWVIQQAQMIRELAREWGGVEKFLKAFPDALPSGAEYDPDALRLALDPDEIRRQREIFNINTDPVLGYKHLAGEVEARNVQTRRDFTPDQRRAQPPWETEDVPRDRQIVRFRGGIKNMIMEGR